ncbi:MAG TPA: glutamine amidotransferase, partial [Opitutaceae bacterium]|nr:glutamine amidotransferase [Opitutaceae bacterium]
FDTRLHATLDFRELDSSGRSSGIAGALQTLQQRFQGRPLAGVLLLTDGNATDIKAALPSLTGLPPIYPVVVGDAQNLRDIALQQVNVTQTAFEDAPVTVQVDVSAYGYQGRPIVAQILDREAKVVQEQTLEASNREGALTYRFTLRPEGAGLSFYRVKVGARGASGQLEEGTAEATLANNTRVIAVDRGRGPYRVLYVTGRPNWEFKFLNRAIEEDPQLQMVALIRVAKREPKFDFRGRSGETSNPLFRGFGEQSAEDVQRYDQPVLVRLNTKDEHELRNGFPRTEEELYAYDAVIVDDLEAEFFGTSQAQLMQRFVSERGGGFLMLGGMESFQAGGYFRTPIGDMLPVYLDRLDAQSLEGAADGPEPRPIQFELAREGWLQAWARLYDNESQERARLEGMPAFRVVNRVRGVKPGASVIATGRDESGTDVPALAVQRFGRGRTAGLMAGDLWRWGTRDADRQAQLGKAWRQLARWLVSDVPQRVDLQVESVSEDVSGAVNLNVRVRDAKYQPVDDASVSIDVESVSMGVPGEETSPLLRLRAEATGTEAGLYTASFLPRHTGGFKATAIAANNAGAEIGRGVAGWTADLAADEFKSLVPNLPLLETIAKETGGQVLQLSDLASFAKSLPEKSAPIMETVARPIWHTPLLFGIALACLAAEWGLRRWKGLP